MTIIIYGDNGECIVMAAVKRSTRGNRGRYMPPFRPRPNGRPRIRVPIDK